MSKDIVQAMMPGIKVYEADMHEGIQKFPWPLRPPAAAPGPPDTVSSSHRAGRRSSRDVLLDRPH